MVSITVKAFDICFVVFGHGRVLIVVLAGTFAEIIANFESLTKKFFHLNISVIELYVKWTPDGGTIPYVVEKKCFDVKTKVEIDMYE